MTDTPRWLRFLEKRLSFLAVPNIGILVVTLQALGALMLFANPLWAERLMLLPEAFRAGEYWRLITFLSLPPTLNPILLLFSLWFLYFVLSTIESQWGSFKTTFYALITWLVTVAYALVASYPVTHSRHFESTLFLAAAALFPETEVQFFFVLPVKMKWLAAFSLALVGWEFAQGDWADRFYLLSIYSAYFVFFGPSAVGRLKQVLRKQRYVRQTRDR